MLPNSNNISEKTLTYYRQNAAAYIEETIENDMRVILDSFLIFVQDGGHILDLGCGSGRDSRFFIDNGYQVTATDASLEIAEFASAFLVQEVLIQPAQSINEIEKYDGVWACASLLHVPRTEIFGTFVKIIGALKPGGIWYMSFKHGAGEYWDERGRYFNCYTTQSMTKVIRRLFNIEIISIAKDFKQLRGKPQCWLNIFIRKKEAC